MEAWGSTRKKGGTSSQSGFAGFGSSAPAPAPVYQPQPQPQPAPFQAAPPPSPAPAPATPPPLANTAQINPEMQQFMGQIRGRIAQQQARAAAGDPNLQTQVNRVGERISADTRQRATDFAAADIDERASGAQRNLTADLQRRGVAGTGVEAELRRRIDETAQKEKARAAAGIALGRERDIDSLVLGSQGIMAAPGQTERAELGMGDSLIGAGVGAAGTAAQLAQSQLGLNLNQWQAQNAANRASNQDEIAAWLAMNRMGGVFI